MEDKTSIARAGALSALDLARSIETGELTPLAVVDICAQAIVRHEPQIGAFVAYDVGATQRAAAVAGLSQFPLRGLPVAVKDIFDTADLPTEYGSPIYVGHRPKADAAMISLLH